MASIDPGYRATRNTVTVGTPFAMCCTTTRRPAPDGPRGRTPGCAKAAFAAEYRV